MSSHASMNRIFRLVWNDVSGTWIAVAEVARGRVKRSGRAARRMIAALAAAAVAATSWAAPPAPAPNQLPTGGVVAAGTATLRTAPGGSVLDVDQRTQRAVVDWSTFDIGSAAQVRFNQPGTSSVTLNRVLGSDPSQIAGRITAPGQVFLTNPNGIVFGKTATVDVGGLTASTLGIGDADFMAGKTSFSGTGAAGSVVNEGTLRASLGGYIALLAPEVRNQGVVIARLGTVALAAGDAVSLDFDAAAGGSRLAGITVQASALQALVRNQGAVLAPGGLIVLSARALDRLQGGIVNNSGRLEATGLSTKAGRIVLEASDLVESSGSIHADAGARTPTAGPAGSVAIDAQDIALGGVVTAVAEHGQGGSIGLVASRNIDLSGAVLDVSGGTAGGSVRVQGGATPVDLALGVDGPAAVTTSGATRLVADSRLGAGGRIALTADTVRVLDQTRIDARGTTAGGTVQVGGGYQGSGTLPQARRVEFDPGASIDASATGAGGGGTVSLWSDIHRADSGTIARGTLSARGGAQGGDGGRIETSGHWIDVAGARVDASAVHGAAGNWLLDPYNVTISSSSPNNSVGWAPTGSGSNIYINDLTTALNSGTSITATTGSSGSELGDITVNAAIAKTAGGDVTLKLQAANSIVVNNPISSSSGKLNLVLDADNDNGTRDGAGIVILNSNISTNGGSLAFGTGATLAINGMTTKVGGDVYVGGSSAQSITTAGGAIAVNGEMILANTSGLSVSSGNGNVMFGGLLNSGDSYTSVPGTAGTGSWDQAFAAAKGSTGGGAAVGDTYLATITSRLENAVASRVANYTGAWFGAHRDINNGNGLTWRWVAGPEGLEAGGSGRAFFQQSSAGGGSAINGQYSNFDTGEPNGTGTTGEQVAQFFGTFGRWNDLVSNTNYGNSGSYGVTQYLRENNLAGSPLTINAGSGLVTFAGMVGGTKALASLSVTSPSIKINGGGVTTQGLQTYNGNITLGSPSTVLTQTTADTDFGLQANRAITNATGGSANFSIVTTGSITLGSGSSINSTTGALNTTLNADSDASGSGYIWLQNNSSGTAGVSINTNGGAITLSGGANLATGYAQGSTSGNGNGVTLDSATLVSNGGNIVIRGRGATSASSFVCSEISGTCNATDGVRTLGANLVNAGSGTISVTGAARGTDGSASNGIETSASTGYSRYLSSATNTTAITFAGDASVGTAPNGWGTFLWGGNSWGTLLAATGSGGTISISGTGRAGIANAGGVHLEPSAFVLAASGAISLNGIKGSASTYEDLVINGSVGFASTVPSGFGPSPVTASSSNITITADSLSQNRVFGNGTYTGSAVQSSGVLSIAPRTPGKALTVQSSNPGGTGLWVSPDTLFGSSGLFKTGFSKLVFGSSTTGTVTLDNYRFDNDTEIDTAGNAVLGSVSVPNHKLSVNVTGNGSITDTGNVAVSALSLSGSGSAATLDSSGNAIGTVAANVASLALTDASALTVGAAGGLSGITATGTVAVNTLAGDLTVAQNIASGSTGTSAVMLNAGQSTAAGTSTGGNIVRSGTPTITTGSGGRATLMTGSVAGSTGVAALAGSGSGRFRYASDETTTAYTAPLGSGIDVIYREQPSLTSTASAASKVYDGVAYSGGNGNTVTGYLNGDTATILGGSPTYAGSAQGATAAGTYTITPGGLTNTLGYGFGYVGGALTIGQRSVSLTGTRPYDGTTGIAGSVLGVANTVGSDSLSLTGSGTLADKSIGSRAITSFGSLALGGSSAANYTLVGASGSVSLTAAPLSVGAPSGVTKTYDSTTIAPVAANVGTLAGAAAGDTVGTVALVSYADANAGSGKTVQAGGLRIVDSHGTDVTANYAVTYVPDTTGVITRAPLTVTANDDARFVTQADNPGYYGAHYDGLVGSETASVLGGTLAIARTGAGSNGAAGSYPGALVPSGVTSSNYAVAFANGDYTILPADRLLVRIANTSAVYGSAPAFGVTSAQYLDANGTTLHTLSGTASGNTFSYSDGVGGGATFTLAPQGTRLSSGGLTTVGNYKIGDPGPTITGANFDRLSFVGNLAVTRAALTPNASNVSKVYDSTTAMTGLTLGLGGAQSGDVLTLSGTGAFSQKVVGTGLAYSVVGLVLGGPDANDYYLSSGAGFNGSNGVITPASLPVSGIGAAGKVYDSFTTAVLTGAPMVTPIGGDVVSVVGSGTGTFADARVGTNKAVAVSGFTLSGADAGNYAVQQPTGVTASITPALLATSGSPAAVDKVYDATTVAALVGAPTPIPLGNDIVAIGGTGIGAFADKNVGANKPVTVSGYTLTGADAGNYLFVQPTGLTASITPAPLNVGGNLAAVDKVYDATSVATLSGTPAVTPFGGDVVGISGSVTGAFADKNVGRNKPVTAGGLALTGTDAGNYVLVQPTGLSASITPAPLSASGNLAAVDKVYDATTVAALTGTLTVTPLGGDVVGIGSTGIGSFADKNVGANKPVAVSGATLTGVDAGNYVLVQPTGLAASITPAPLSVGGNLAALDKVYDATTVATLGGAPSVAPLGSDVVSLGGIAVGRFADKNAGAGKAITVSGFTLDGADAGNYLLALPVGLRADITPRPLHIEPTVADKVYDATTRASVTLADDRIAGDVLSLGYGSATYADKNAGPARPVGISGIAATGTDAANYSVPTTALAAGDVAKAALQVAATGTSKTYDATTAATVTLGDNRLTGDVLALGYASAMFADKNAGLGKVVDVVGISVTGPDAANYRFNTDATTTADIGKALLTVGAVAQSRVYDGTTTASVSLTDNRLGSDQLTLSFASASFVDPAVGVAKPVGVDGIRIAGGADQTNYLLGNTTATATADILRAPVAAAPPVDTTASLPPVVAPVATVVVPTARGGVDLTLPGTAVLAGAASVLSAPQSTALGATAAGGGSSANAVVVAMAQPAAAGQPGLVTVSVPTAVAAAGSGFDFPLPAEVAQVNGSDTARVTLLDGAPLPGWLSYSGANRSFSASSAPAGALPIELAVRIGSQEWRVTVAERQGN